MKSIFLSLLCVSALAAQTPAAKAPAKSASTAKKAPSGATAAKKPPMLNPAAYKAKAPDLYEAKFVTTKGDVVIEVHRDWAPLGADRFYNLVKGGFYDGAPLFRVIQNFMAQFGLSANPAVSKAWQNANLRDDPVKQSNKRGYVSFATAGPNTRTTQVFINFKDNSFLDSQGFAPFAIVTSGMENVDKFAFGEADQQKLTEEGIAYIQKSMPNLDRITSATIVPAAKPAAAPAKP
ncbi:MAG TPA: peptidylprolyl isomerase [Bryobacteraceae bacterium]|nr:peptidylprolyl isomerase [Bryobacteraceae bacterium]